MYIRLFFFTVESDFVFFFGRYENAIESCVDNTQSCNKHKLQTHVDLCYAAAATATVGRCARLLFVPFVKFNLNHDILVIERRDRPTQRRIYGM